LSQRRVAVVSSAALIRRGDVPFHFGSPEVRFLPASAPLADLLVSHVSINFDRSGYQRDTNTVYPIERLSELVDEGVIGVGDDALHSDGLYRSEHDGRFGRSDQWATATGTHRRRTA